MGSWNSRRLHRTAALPRRADDANPREGVPVAVSFLSLPDHQGFRAEWSNEWSAAEQTNCETDNVQRRIRLPPDHIGLAITYDA